MRMHVRAALFGMLAVAAIAAIVPAQLAGTTEIITGVVTNAEGQPVEGARVEVTSTESQVTRRFTTDARGRFTILFPDGGGQYQIVVRALGMAPYTAMLARQGEEDRIVTTIQLSTTASVLQRVVTRAPQRTPSANVGRPEPGNVERQLTPDQLSRLPIDASDIADIASLAPGVVTIPGTDSTAAGFSVAGQRPDQNAVTLDGAQFGGSTIPSEALRVTRVITGSYDVGRGQFTGGQVASTTRSGTNRVQGTFTYGMRDPTLQWEDDRFGSMGRGYTQHTLSGGLGGPLQRNRLFAFGSFQLRRRTDPLESLASADAAALERFGASADSVARFLETLSRYGLPPSIPGVPGRRTNDDVTLLGRMDWTLSDAHSVTLRGDVRIGDQTGGRIGPLSVPHVGGDTRTGGTGLLLSARSQLGATLINEARAYWARDDRDAEPYLDLPHGRVRVASLLDDGTRAVSVLEFGGNTALPQTARNSSLEISDEASWVQPGGAHRVKLGLSMQRIGYDELTISNRGGTYTFPSLSDFDSARASSFTRTLTSRARTGALLAPAVYLGDIWRARRGLQIDAGVRVESSHPQGSPAYNRAVDSVFSRRTDRLPDEIAISPRVGFSYTPPALGRLPRYLVRGGIGDFRGRLPVTMFAAALDATGLAGGQTQLICVGAAVPTPDWDLFRIGGEIPATCADGAPPQLVTDRRAVTTFSESFGAARVVRASLGVQRRVGDRFSLGIDGLVSLGRHQPAAIDLNLLNTPRFLVANESARPVYVPTSAIVPRTGAISLSASRRDTSFAQVFEIGSALRSRTVQVTVTGGGLTIKGLAFNGSYSWTMARDQSSFACCTAQQAFAASTTSGDPGERLWARSDLERRHAVTATATYPVTAWLEVTSIGRVISGAPYTPMIGGDMNGDGARNDRAFVFDPDVSDDRQIITGMRALLDGAPDRARRCLARQLGTIAGRGSCTGPWTTALDLQANMRPNSFGLSRRLTISIITVNTLPGIDRLLHGERGARGWGVTRRPDNTLLYVRGFDPVRNRFRYEVNGRFGDDRGTRLVSRAPFMLALQMRMTVGPDPARERLGQLFGAGGARSRAPRRGAAATPGRGGAGVGGLANAAERGADVARLFSRMIPNPLLRILSMRDSLGLTAAQDTLLLAVNERYVARIDTIARQVAEAVRKAGDNPDLPTLAAVVGPQLLEGRRAMMASLEEAKGILTRDQWGLLPPAVRDPARAAPRAPVP